MTQAFSGAIDGLDEGNVGISAERVAAAAVLGGTTSALTGGKFANGAITGAFSRAFNDDQAHQSDEEKLKVKIQGDIKGVISATIDSDGRLTAALKAGDPISFTLDTDGNITVAGKNLIVKTTIPSDKLGSGLSFGAFSVTAVADSEGNISFSGSAKIPVKTDLFGLKIVISKTINLPNAFFNSSGLLGTAARAGRDRTQKIDDAVRCADEGGEGC